VSITVEEVFDNDHQVVRQKGPAVDKFMFVAADAGSHRICFTPSHASAGGWPVGGQALGSMKLSLDLVIGETSKIESTDKGKMQDIVSKLKELNGRLQDIRREQVFQRVSGESAKPGHRC
jgi:p24 family protein alpha